MSEIKRVVTPTGASIDIRVIPARPPMWAEITKAFPIAVKQYGVIYAWADRIYNPDNVMLTLPLLAHESVHAQQHHEIGGPENWWRRYIDDVQFRLDQEIPAHVAELKVMLAQSLDRAERRWCKATVARKMANPIYGYGKLLTIDKARAFLNRGMS